MGLLRFGVALTVAAAALCWVIPSWQTCLLGILAQLPVTMWRNCRIACDKRHRFTISGVTGLRWTYTYAEVHGLHGPFLHAGGHVFLLWPGMVNRAAFIEQLRSGCEVAARDAKYRRNAPPRQPENEASMKKIGSAVLLTGLVALLVVFANQPITPDTGHVYEVTLRSAERFGNDIRMDFGYRDRFELPYSEATSPLLEDCMRDSDFTVRATHHTGRRTRDRYEIIELTGKDGTVYYTWQDAEAQRQHEYPSIILLAVAVLLLPCITHTDRSRQKHKS